MLERRRQGLCYNCDEPYVRGHQCKRLFNLLLTNDLSEEDAALPVVGADDAALLAALLAEQPRADSTEEPVVSLHC